MDILLVKLLIAHILGDFFLQPDKWVKEKEVKKLRSQKLYLHTVIHGLLILLLVWNLSLWPQALVLMIVHGIIDAAKLLFQKEKSKRLWFFADQVLHLTSIFIIWYFTTTPQFKLSFLNNPVFWTNVAAILMLTFPSSIIIRVLIAKWTPNTSTTITNTAETSLQSAGKYIGIMERLLVFVFIYTNHFDAIGFLIAAKSIFRFGDLKEANDLKLTEYVLIGTFLSFGIAVFISLIVSNIS
ncbi:DUF3307 domain-containing protein [Pedobacter sp. P351]|uniref:DUF3307 domain-containing protein n=1 Tax=Pedobacter superstes TaxID=3133441 RepID=UPI0030B4A451